MFFPSVSERKERGPPKDCERERSETEGGFSFNTKTKPPPYANASGGREKCKGVKGGLIFRSPNCCYLFSFNSLILIFQFPFIHSIFILSIISFSSHISILMIHPIFPLRLSFLCIFVKEYITQQEICQLIRYLRIEEGRRL